jgi:hypothetical protein
MLAGAGPFFVPTAAITPTQASRRPTPPPWWPRQPRTAAARITSSASPASQQAAAAAVAAAELAQAQKLMNEANAEARQAWDTAANAFDAVTHPSPSVQKLL